MKKLVDKYFIFFFNLFFVFLFIYTSGIYNSHAENSQYVYFKVNQGITNKIPRTDFAAEFSRICNKKTSHTIILTYL